MSKLLTIFTPTYNRCHTLSKLYDSLCRQTCHEFEWLIIDDGSTDDTQHIAESWIREAKIYIRYIYKENGGLHTGYNMAYANITSELSMCTDSDDYMPSDAVESVKKFWEQHGSSRVAGIVALEAHENGDIIGTNLPENLKKERLYDLYNKHGVRGDKHLVYRTEIARQHPMPVIYKERGMPTAYMFYQIDKQFPLLLLNHVLCIKEYRDDGMTNNVRKYTLQSPNSMMLYQKLLAEVDRSLIRVIKSAVNYTIFSHIAGNKGTKLLAGAPDRLFAMATLPIAIGIYYAKYRKWNGPLKPEGSTPPQ